MKINELTSDQKICVIESIFKAMDFGKGATLTIDYQMIQAQPIEPVEVYCIVERGGECIPEVYRDQKDIFMGNKYMTLSDASNKCIELNTKVEGFKVSGPDRYTKSYHVQPDKKTAYKASVINNPFLANFYALKIDAFCEAQRLNKFFGLPLLPTM